MALAKRNLPDDAPHILVVDDDSRIRTLLSRFLNDNGYRVTGAGSAAEARLRLEGLAFDLIVLDVMMPGESGLDLARDLKSRSHLPILMLTALAEPDARVTGLETGVDDYVPKPFEPRELLLRVGNILRRSGPSRTTDAVRFGPFTFDPGRGDLRQGSELIRLTERERELLKILAAKQGDTVPRLVLVGSDAAGERAVDVQINRLRRKIETDPANPTYLQTVRGVGYRLLVDL
ncbi:DNA-binding response regulator [Agaricicola taiwanensis]|uniref:DNA-binding response regulator n=1 Tax=Agaricicola taiwanensis TaxID=591372 RepID=A0A8J2YDK1_9RHOB|nr:response regulator transcription factor [Agaricicola taiwanensis]GGE40269.1 DNA-binding response regulator [Agaricicola taiwanensis]